MVAQNTGDGFVQGMDNLKLETPIICLINQLPPELLVQIFACCRGPSADIALLPARVGSLWRRVTLETPSLWTPIEMGYYWEIDAHQELLHRTKDAPVELTIESIDKDRTLVIELLQQNLPHVSRLSLVVENDTSLNEKYALVASSQWFSPWARLGGRRVRGQ